MSKGAQLGPSHPWFAEAIYRTGRPVLAAMFAGQSFYSETSAYAAMRLAEVREKLRRGKTVYLLGLGPAGHNAGAALLRVAPGGAPEIVCNNEEERYSGVKHEAAFPVMALSELLEQARRMGIGPEQIDVCLASWDYAALFALLLRTALEESPSSWCMLRPSAFPGMNITHLFQACRSPYKLAKTFGVRGAIPLVGMRHHDNHAYFSFGVSPFANSPEPVMVSVLDGFGDDGSISLYLAEKGNIRRLRSNGSVFDSLGIFFSFLSSTQGGWTILSSEGRYMGAAAWGNQDRLTNKYYPGLRQIFYLGPDGDVTLNRALANWPRNLLSKPYTPELRRIIGDPTPAKMMWKPDAVLRVESLGTGLLSQDRFDIAAATQMVFEDVLFHVIGHLIRSTGSSRLVLSGGTALNGLANMRLMEHFNEEFYERSLGLRDTRLHLWVPPIPGDAGVTAGAAYQFAIRAGARWGAPLEHSFYCGHAPTHREILEALRASGEIGWTSLGDVSGQADREAVVDLMASVTAGDGVLALFQGPAETGPRALGHRSILANPCNPKTLQVLNQTVKYRESVRPLAPMATRAAAERWFELAPGAADAEYNAYRYMVLTARARPEAYARIPAVIHRDGTARIQIVEEAQDAFTYAYLRALGRRIGVEVAVNTSFNVAGPIVQTPRQALEALKRAKGMDAVFFISAEGPAYVAWDNIDTLPKDGGRRLRQWLTASRVEAGAPGVRTQA
jgi:carbamoyltransferase